MSRIGKKPIIIPEKVEAKVSDASIVIKGPKGELKQEIHPNVNIAVDGGQIIITVKDSSIKSENSLWGLFGSLVRNMITGVTQGFERKLEINGIGYKASVNGSKLQLSLGFSHTIDFPLPAGITAAVDKNIVIITGIDKQLVGETAARIRRLKKPEPYKGTGIRFVNEIVRKKAGKAAKAAGAASK